MDDQNVFPSVDQDGFARSGLSLRDLFAGLAMCGLVASKDEGAGDRLTELPTYAYEIADAMLTARTTG